MNNNFEFAGRVRFVWKSFGLTQNKFVEFPSATQSTTSEIEKSKLGASTTLIKLICIQFQINENWLAVGERKMRIDRANSQPSEDR